MTPARALSLPQQLALLIPGAFGGAVAYALGMPLPFLLGGMAAVAAITIALTARGFDVAFPKTVRRPCVGLIGTMIGATFTPAMMGVIPSLWISLLAMVLFAALAYGLSYVIYTRLGRYDRVTAAYAAMPGGLIEAVSLGTEAGADARLLSVQHFARIVIVVTLVPMGFWLWDGQTVGSASGQMLSARAAGLGDLAVIALITAAGIWIAPRLRLPAAHLMGPMVLSAVVHGSGLWTTASPLWLLNLAQLVVGAGLGAMFGGATLAMLTRAFAYGTLVVLLMLVLTVIFAVSLAQVLPLPIETLIISFAPGGVTEMGLIALSLGASPVFVAIHHLFRIALTAFAAGYLLKRGGSW